MTYLPPKLWKPSEQFSPADFNAFVSGNMSALANRPSQVWFNTNLAGSDNTFSNTTFAQHTGGPISNNYTVQVVATAPSKALFTLLIPIRIDTTAGQDAFIDIYWVEKDVYLSSMTNTPATNGLWFVETVSVDQNISYPFVWVQPDIPEGTHTFELWVRVAGNTATEDLDQLPFGFASIIL